MKIGRLFLCIQRGCRLGGESAIHLAVNYQGVRREDEREAFGNDLIWKIEIVSPGCLGELTRQCPTVIRSARWYKRLVHGMAVWSDSG